MYHFGSKFFKVNINYDLGLTLIYFLARINFVPWVFLDMELQSNFTPLKF